MLTSLKPNLSHAVILFLALSTAAAPAAACPSPAEQAALRAAVVKEWRVPAAKLDYFEVVGPAKPAGPCIAVVSIRDEGECHACGATINLVEFTRAGGRWKRRFVQRGVLEIGSFGHAPKPSFVAGGLLRFDHSGMGQGNGYSSLVLVAKVRGHYREVLHVATGSDNNGAFEGPYWEWKAEPRFVPRSGRLPDIALDFSGTEEGSAGLQAAKRTETWTFADTAYVMAPKKVD